MILAIARNSASPDRVTMLRQAITAIDGRFDGRAPLTPTAETALAEEREGFGEVSNIPAKAGIGLVSGERPSPRGRPDIEKPCAPTDAIRDRYARQSARMGRPPSATLQSERGGRLGRPLATSPCGTSALTNSLIPLARGKAVTDLWQALDRMAAHPLGRVPVLEGS